MNKKRFEELKTKTDAALAAVDAKRAELQAALFNANAEVETWARGQDVAAESGDPASFAEALTRKTYYEHKARSLEGQLRETFSGPVLPSADYEELRAFLEAESGETLREEYDQIRKHLEAVENITKKYKDYHSELYFLAEQADNACKRGTGQRISIARMPEHWYADALRSLYTSFSRPEL